MNETLQIRIHGQLGGPTLVYLPGLHGDWTLITDFRRALSEKICFVEFTYPRTGEWSLADYASAVRESLRRHDIREGWLLGESFGSQVVWALLKQTIAQAQTDTSPAFPFHVRGVILAGGFVRHPAMLAVRLVFSVCSRLPARLFRHPPRLYAIYARGCYRLSAEARASLQEFVDRRTNADRCAAIARLRLIAEGDLRPIARATTVPVFHLTGLIDPIVPPPWVRLWLRWHCPGYRGGRTLWKADHNVLGSAPRKSAQQILNWMIDRESGPCIGKGDCERLRKQAIDES